MDDYEVQSQLAEFYGGADASWLECATAVVLQQREVTFGTRSICPEHVQDVTDEEMRDFSVGLLSDVKDICGAVVSGQMPSSRRSTTDSAARDGVRGAEGDDLDLESDYADMLDAALDAYTHYY